MKTTTPIKTKAGEIAEFVPVAGLIVKLFRSDAYHGNREDGNGFRPTSIQKDGTTLWSFDALYLGTGKIAEFMLYGDDEQVIVVRDRNTVYEIVRIMDYAHAKCAKFDDKVVMIGGSSKELLLDMKIQAAEALEMRYWPSPAEMKIINRRLQIAHEKRQAAKAAKEAAGLQLRTAACEAIMARKIVEAWTADGSRRYGVPVTGNEWRSLKDNTFCILMVDGQPTESFIVEKNGTQAKKIKISQVSATKPTPKLLNDLPVAIDMMEVTIGDETKDIFVFASTEDIKRLRPTGDSEEWAGVRKDVDGDITVYKVTKNGFNPLHVIKVVLETA